jgi:hypothetical protein
MTPAQMRKIWATAKEIADCRLQIADCDAWVHGVVYQVTGRESLRELSVNEGKRVIDFLERMANRKPGQEWHGEHRFSVDENGNLIVIITPAQAAKMRAVAARIGWDDRQVCTVATRQLGRNVNSLRAIRAEEAFRVMRLLEQIVEDREKRERQMEIGASDER